MLFSILNHDLRSLIKDLPRSVYDVTIVDICACMHVVYKGNNRILSKKKLKFRKFFVK
jgi:ribosomal protein L31